MVGREVLRFQPFENTAFSVGSSSSMGNVVCLPVLGGVPSCVFPTHSGQQSLSLSWGMWSMDLMDLGC